MICTKSRVEISQMHEAVNQQSRADQQDERDRYFANNEQTANAIALCASDGIAAAFLERLVKTEIGRLRGWREPKDQSRQQRNTHCKDQHVCIDADRLSLRDRVRNECL